MASQTELVDLQIPSEFFEEPRSYELAVAVRARGTNEQRIASAFERLTVYAGGADRISHPCVSAGSISDLESVFPYRDYQYLTGYIFGLLYPRGIEWEQLKYKRSGSPGDEVTLDWFIQAHSHDRTAAFLPIMNGRPIGPVQFRQIVNEGDPLKIALQDSLTVTLPDADVADIYVAQWIDPYYPLRAPDGTPVVFPEDDAHGNAGERTFGGGPFGGTNALRYVISNPEGP